MEEARYRCGACGALLLDALAVVEHIRAVHPGVAVHVVKLRREGDRE